MFQGHRILWLVSYLFIQTHDLGSGSFIKKSYKNSEMPAGKNSGPSSSSGPQSHQIFCCAFNAHGNVFVTGSSDHLARVYLNSLSLLAILHCGHPIFIFYM
jgi:WD40 repeat protein